MEKFVSLRALMFLYSGNSDKNVIFKYCNKVLLKQFDRREIRKVGGGRLIWNVTTVRIAANPLCLSLSEIL